MCVFVRISYVRHAVGATGKTGLLVVEELLNRNVEVVGLVRNQSKAEEIFSSFNNTMLQIKPCNLTDPIDVETKITGCDALIWWYVSSFSFFEFSN